MHALTGTWIANLEQSRRDPNHQFHRATMRFEELARERHGVTEKTFNAKLAEDAKVPIVRPAADEVGRAANRNES
jgi:hypothetical protein